MSHLDTYQLPESLRVMVDMEIEPGERITWLAQPIPGRVSRSAIPIFLFGIPWTAFAVFWTVMASFAAQNVQGQFDFLGWLFPLWGVPFIVAGLGMLSSPFWVHRKATRSAYVLTDRRAILFNAGWRGTVRVRSFEPNRLRDLRRNQYPDGSGDLIFTLEYLPDADRGKPSKDVGFLAIRDVKQVEERVRALAGTTANDIAEGNA